ncbi:hypothetical protein HC766_02240 [Candidatus Gracilibacteria bacterium]|nr:hypothetical protein [Candidatus Gracilibacteria bacterium]
MVLTLKLKNIRRRINTNTKIIIAALEYVAKKIMVRKMNKLVLEVKILGIGLIFGIILGGKDVKIRLAKMGKKSIPAKYNGSRAVAGILGMPKTILVYCSLSPVKLKGIPNRSPING